MSLLDIVQQHLGPEQIQQISQHLGTDPATTSNAIAAALPMIVGGMAHTAQQPGGAAAIQSAVDQHSAGGILGSLGGLAGMLGGASNSGGGIGGILGSILGQHTDTVQNGVQTASGLDAAKVKSLLAILAPIVMAALAQHAASQPSSTSSSGGLGSILQQAASAAQKNSGGSSQVGGVLGQILGGLTHH
ncbi:MAG: DUF937 domain-containing protein [Gemmatimonadaceae bacterium]|nr:DUF937 domain-containing protein [Gemmatimonadaceae bacterium]